MLHHVELGSSILLYSIVLFLLAVLIGLILVTMSLRCEPMYLVKWVNLVIKVFIT